MNPNPLNQVRAALDPEIFPLRSRTISQFWPKFRVSLHQTCRAYLPWRASADCRDRLEAFPCPNHYARHTQLARYDARRHKRRRPRRRSSTISKTRPSPRRNCPTNRRRSLGHGSVLPTGKLPFPARGKHRYSLKSQSLVPHRTTPLSQTSISPDTSTTRPSTTAVLCIRFNLPPRRTQLRATSSRGPSTSPASNRPTTRPSRRTS